MMLLSYKMISQI